MNATSMMKTNNCSFATNNFCYICAVNIMNVRCWYYLHNIYSPCYNELLFNATNTLGINVCCKVVYMYMCCFNCTYMYTILVCFSVTSDKVNVDELWVLRTSL